MLIMLRLNINTGMFKSCSLTPASKTKRTKNEGHQTGGNIHIHPLCCLGPNREGKGSVA